MFDGTMRDLNPVRYVIDLRRNLISLRMIDQASWSIKAEKGEFHIIENGLVILKGLHVEAKKVKLWEV